MDGARSRRSRSRPHTTALTATAMSTDETRRIIPVRRRFMSPSGSRPAGNDRPGTPGTRGKIGTAAK